MSILDAVRQEGRTVLSEYESKRFLSEQGIPVTRERLVTDERSLQSAVREIGYPVVLKGCTAEAAHKTEKGLIRLDVRSDAEAEAAFGELMARMNGSGAGVLVQEMIRGSRELVVGLTRDSQFGPCVMFGLGGIFTEILEDVVFRVAPLDKRDALEMMEEIRGRRILESVRGMPPVDRDQLADILVRVSRIGMEYPEIQEIDINPLLLAGSRPVAVDGLVVLGD